MLRDNIANTALAVLSFVLGQYFGANYADYLISVLAYQPFLPSIRWIGSASRSKSSSRRTFTLIRGLV